MAQYDLTINKGETFLRTVTWHDSTGAPVNLLGYSARMMVRHKITDAAPVISLSSPSGGLVLGDAAGTISITIDDTTTSSVSAPYGVYDLELVSPTGIVTRLLEGSVTFTPEVTR